jgi:hypothetical protein
MAAKFPSKASLALKSGKNAGSLHGVATTPGRAAIIHILMVHVAANRHGR